MGLRSALTRPFIDVLVWVFLFPAALFAQDSTGEENALPVRSVALFSSGVGYFQHAGSLEGGSEVQLPFSAQQISDVLKSLVMEDLDGGVPGFVLYPSENSKNRILSGFQVDLSDNPSLADILTQLRGSQITAHHQGKALSGRLLGVEQRPVSVEGSEEPVVDWFLNLATTAGFRVVPLRELEQLSLDQGGDRRDLAKALEALDEMRSKNSKKMVLHFPGQGVRKVRLGYVVETPVWKSSYRLILPAQKEGAKGSGEGRIQGWAVVENQSDNDWQDVQLSLVSGRPISFIQDLYKPRYITRPTIQPENHAAIQPQRYTGGVAPSAGQMVRGKSSRMAMAPMMAREAQEDGRVADDHWQQESIQPSLISAASSEEAGALFHFTVNGVDLPRRRGAMIPFISKPIKLEKVSLYNQQVLADHPLNGLFLENSTATHLPPGPVTLFDGGLYGGDALLDNLPAGEKRLLSYGIDLDVRVNTSHSPQEMNITSGRIVKGVFYYSQKQQSSQTFVLDNRSDELKKLIVELPKRQGWAVVGEVQPFESTNRLYRFRTELAPKSQSELKVAQERVLESRIVLLRGRIGQLLEYTKQGALSPSVKKGLNRVVMLHGEVEKFRRLLNQAKQQIGALGREQERIRANLKTVNAQSPFYGRMMKKLDDKETLLEEKQREYQNHQHQLEKAQRDLEQYLAPLELH
ncbi:MAG: hypothetical protein HQL72_02695 [Magnetococcales bacterium]|nr:hypothetical protein [Magnetococcales bacterium]